MAKLDLDDLLRWALLVERMKAWWKGVKGAGVGTVVDVPEMVVEIGNQRWRFPAHTAIREK